MNQGIAENTARRTRKPHEAQQYELPADHRSSFVNLEIVPRTSMRQTQRPMTRERNIIMYCTAQTRHMLNVDVGKSVESILFNQIERDELGLEAPISRPLHFSRAPETIAAASLSAKKG